MLENRHLWLLPYILALFGFLFLAPYDLRINQFLYDPSNLIALFFERLAYLPIVLLIPLCFYALYRIYEKRIWMLWYGISFALICLDAARYWMDMSMDKGLLVLGITCLVAVWITLILRHVPLAYWQTHERFYKLVLAVILSSLATTFVLKQCWGRVRFREMEESISLYTPWYIIQGYNGHHSFPSAHTAVMSTILCFRFYKSEVHSLWQSYLIKALLMGSVFMMMGMRMVAGAHFFSDVLAGFIITYTWMLLWRKRIGKDGCYESKKNPI